MNYHEELEYKMQKAGNYITFFIETTFFPVDSVKMFFMCSKNVIIHHIFMNLNMNYSRIKRNLDLIYGI